MTHSTRFSRSGQVSYVLAGDSDAKNKFVADFIRKEGISSYNLFDYQDTLKIPQVREIKKILSRNPISHQKRLFVIRDATLQAQNALLKTLEELPEDTTFIFLAEFNLIPTILSRSQILNFKIKKINVDINLTSKLREFIEGKRDLYSILLLSDELFGKDPNYNFANLILSLREILIEQLADGQLEKSHFSLNLLKSLYKYFHLVETNNLNKRLLLTRILINQI